jgi:hypothetical protein
MTTAPMLASMTGTERRTKVPMIAPTSAGVLPSAVVLDPHTENGAATDVSMAAPVG